MTNLEIDLRNNQNIITLVFEIYDNPLSHLWINLLKENLESKKIFKKHACFLGWINNKNRTWDNLCDDINENLNNLHNLFPLKVKKLKVDLDNCDSNFFNFTHQIFAELLGLREEVSQEFKNSNIFGRWEIVKLNHLSHELQAFLENKKYQEKELIRPFLNCYFYNGAIKEITDELNKYFTIGSKWGEIYLGSIDVGKNYYDAFNDGDDDIDDSHLMNLSIGTGEFNIHFSDYIFKKEKLNKFISWLKSKNVDINDKKLRLGTGKVGIFKYIKNFETLNQKQILDMIASHDDVYKIKINYGNGNYIENIYDYTRETPTIEIEQLK